MLRLGEALISLRILSPEDLAHALRSQTRNRNLPLGELLVNHGVISREELREALEIKRSQLPDDAPSLPMLRPDGVPDHRVAAADHRRARRGREAAASSAPATCC